MPPSCSALSNLAGSDFIIGIAETFYHGGRAIVPPSSTIEVALM
jgi:hypothetical protein